MPPTLWFQCICLPVLYSNLLCGFLDGPSLINAGHKLSCACVDIPEQWMMHTKEYGIFCPLYFLFYTRAKTWKGGDV